MGNAKTNNKYSKRAIEEDRDRIEGKDKRGGIKMGEKRERPHYLDWILKVGVRNQICFTEISQINRK